MKRALQVGMLIAAVLALTVPLSACGKKGDLEPPPSHAPAHDPDGE
jgi:predicted small lipoprotein YifL